jgi:hypothetical protein
LGKVYDQKTSFGQETSAHTCKSKVGRDEKSSHRVNRHHRRWRCCSNPRSATATFIFAVARSDVNAYFYTYVFAVTLTQSYYEAITYAYANVNSHSDTQSHTYPITYTYPEANPYIQS